MADQPINQSSHFQKLSTIIDLLNIDLTKGVSRIVPLSATLTYALQNNSPSVTTLNHVFSSISPL